MSAKEPKLGAKGCSTCSKRRIRCDGTRPTCLKCAKKGLECPGYGPRLRWAGGVAVRGRLKGQMVPLVQNNAEQPSEQSESMALQAQRRVQVPHNVLSSSPDFLQTALRTSLPQLVDYYDKNLAGLMVWFDSAENDYRRRVLPRVVNTPGLKLAVAAFASHHGSSQFQTQMERFPEAARDACLSMIHTHAQSMTKRLTGGAELTSQSDIENAEWMLASVLMIACYEMANSQSSAAEGHRLAARSIVNIFGSKRGYSSGLFAFLRNQLSIYDVLASTTSFDADDIQNTILPIPGTRTILFTDYLTLLHQVTLISRLPFPVTAETDVKLNDMSLASLTSDQVRDKFTQARGATLVASGRMGIEKSGHRNDFVRLVDTYHHAAVLYAYRCLGHTSPDSPQYQASVNELFEQLVSFENINIFIQNLPWPVFIAGTECHGDPERQQAVRQLLASILEATSFKHYEGVLSFLNAFWAGAQSDWRPLAQDLQMKGFRILVV
ncbi:hypothetical protein K4F52_003810 [Lecanicillium sp. MT-2017a]|nr:hypothetical protein K4F52_003810 [Lecanicillium sp. MT-2017a]